MKFIRLMAFMLFLTAFSAIPSFAQTAASAANPKIAVINTAAFGDEKAGIAKFIAASRQLQTEFKPRQDELSTMNTQLQGLAKELDSLTKQASAPNSPVSTTAVDQKRDQAEKLQRDIQYKQQEAQSAFTKRQEQLLGPIYSDIGKAMQDYARQKGFSMIFDISKDQNGLLLWADDQSIETTTSDFIKFYNARPAGTASATTPK